MAGESLKQATSQEQDWAVWAGPAARAPLRAPVAARPAGTPAPRPPVRARGVAPAAAGTGPVAPPAPVTGDAARARAREAAGGRASGLEATRVQGVTDRAYADGTDGSAWRRLAPAWETLDVDLGLAPAVARVHAHLVARLDACSEREVRLAVGLSHRATSLALEECVARGLAERVPGVRRAGRRGPPGAAWRAIPDPGRLAVLVIGRRRARAEHPAVEAVRRAIGTVREAALEAPADPAVAASGTLLADLEALVRAIDRLAGLAARMAPGELARTVPALDRVPDEMLLRALSALSTGRTSR